MPIADFPVALQPIIQAGYLEHEFRRGLEAVLAFRRCAERETVPVGIGQTITSTRASLLPSVTTPINTASVSTQVATLTAATPILQTAARLDNGLIPQGKRFEQYTLGIDIYAATMDLNIRTSRVAIAPQFSLNAYLMGEQAARSLDDTARNALYATYQGGNTFVRIAATATSVAVDDVRGFLLTAANGTQSTVSPSNPMAVVIGAGLYSVTSVALDVVNVSTAYGGSSGVLTLTGAVSAGDGAQFAPVIAAAAPTVIRPNGKATAQALTPSDKLTMSALLDGVATLESNNAPKIDGLYDIVLGPKSARQLFADPDFKQLFQGATNEAEAFKTGAIESAFLGMRFRRSTQVPVAPHPTIPGLTVQNPIIMGQGALVEGDFEGQYAPDNGNTPGIDEETVVDSIRMVTRPPMDRLNSVITQSWEWIGGFVAPTDVFTDPTTVMSATNAAYKRALVIQHAA